MFSVIKQRLHICSGQGNGAQTATARWVLKRWSFWGVHITSPRNHQKHQ